MLTAILAIFLAASPAQDQQNERVDYVLSELVGNGFSRQEAEAFFRDPRLKVYPPIEVAPRKIDWDKLIAQLVAPESLERGAQFLRGNWDILSQVEQKFGVEKEVLVGLLRLESNFGANTGNYVVFNVFYTSLLGSVQENRWKWAGDNLVALARYCKTTNNDCFQVRGSYGGAVGPAQFLPKSAELYGVDGDGDGVVDLANPRDAIFSAANFLIQHGWREDKIQALGKYYGSANGYPRAVLAYAEALKQRLQAVAASGSEQKADSDLVITLN